jgi:hypothetical protein
MNQNPQNLTVEQMYRTCVIIWLALLISQAMFFVLIFFAKPDLFKFDFSQPLLGSGENSILVIVLAVMALMSVAMSFILKSKFYNQAANEQKPALIQTGLVVACALCEAGSLFGLVLAFAFNYQYFFALIFLGILGVILHFPRRDTFIAASYKR